MYRKPRRTLALRHNSLKAIQPFFSSRDRGGGKGRSTPWGGHEQKLYGSGGTLPSSAGPDMSRWLREKAERNRQALARLSKRLPTIFPPAVLARALGRPFIPPTPRLAIKSYWRAHPIRADRLARALAARTGPPVGWTWRISQSRKAGLPATFRTPPAPYRERAHRLGPGYCCVCGQPVYQLGWHRDLWDAGPNTNAVWHCACVVAWQFWNAPNSEAENPPSPPRAALWPNRQTTMEERRG